MALLYFTPLALGIALFALGYLVGRRDGFDRAEAFLRPSIPPQSAVPADLARLVDGDTMPSAGERVRLYEPASDTLVDALIDWEAPVSDTPRVNCWMRGQS
jgi:hypothetical protein